MDTRSFDIIEPTKYEEIKQKNPLEARFMKAIPEEYLGLLTNMNRKERRKWYSENKKKFI